MRSSSTGRGPQCRSRSANLPSAGSRALDASSIHEGSMLPPRGSSKSLAHHHSVGCIKRRVTRVTTPARSRSPGLRDARAIGSGVRPAFAAALGSREAEHTHRAAMIRTTKVTLLRVGILHNRRRRAAAERRTRSWTDRRCCPRRTARDSTSGPDGSPCGWSSATGTGQGAPRRPRGSSRRSRRGCAHSSLAGRRLRAAPCQIAAPRRFCKARERRIRGRRSRARPSSR